MNARTENRITEMKKQTIGVEIEMANITRQNAIRVVAAYFGTESTVNHDGGSYDAWSCRDNRNRTWKITRDVSIHARNDYEKAELGTPILGYEDIEDLQELARQLRRNGAVSDPEHGCGVHVHIGADGHTAKTLRNLANLMASHENLLCAALKLDSERIRRYCRTVNEDFLKKLNSKKPKTMAQLADIWYGTQGADYERSMHYNSSRYHMLNYHATFTKGTVEFRLFQFDNPGNGRKGGIHAGQLKAYIQLCLFLSQMAKDSSFSSPAPQQTENSKFAMRTWLIRLGMVGEEFETCRNFLTKNLGGNAAWR